MLLDGRHGLAGWQWLFIVDFLITLPVAFYGFFIFPDTPATTRAKYLTPEERAIAAERLPEVVKARGVLGWSIFKRVLGTWHWWGFVLLWIFASNTEMFSTNAIMNLWLKSTGDYSIEQVNYLPSAVAGVGILGTLFFGWYSDFTKQRWHVGVALAFTAIISGAMMLNPPSRGGKFFALYLNGLQYASQTVMFVWANDLTRKDDAKRAIVLASMNTFAIAVYMFWSLVFYNATQVPDWRAGSIAMMAMGVALLLATLACYYLQRRQQAQEQVDDGLTPSTSHQDQDLEKVTTEAVGKDAADHSNRQNAWL